MAIRLIIGTMFCMALASMGCSRSPRGGPRLKTTPLKGVVHVDGEPAALVLIECHPDADTSELKSPLMTNTDDKGNFSFGMYESEGGLPAGTYKLTFTWMTMGLNRHDKLKGLYA